MKKLSGVVLLVIAALMFCFVTGCTQETSSDKTSGSKNKTQQTETAQAVDDAQASSADTQQTSGDTASSGGSRLDDFTEEEQKIMGDLTGTWEQRTPGADGSTNIVRAKIDNVSGFTLTTGTVNAAGEGTYYSHVGSYEVIGDMIRFSATTGGESNDGSSYTLRMDPGVYEYKFSENPEHTQLVLTPDNDNARNLTGGDAITLAKS